MGGTVRLIFNQGKLKRRRVSRELPEISEIFTNKKIFYVVAGGIICLLSLAFFLLAVWAFQMVKIFEKDIPPEAIKGFLVIVAGLVLWNALREIGGTIRGLRYYLGDKQLLGTFPITWKQIYLAKLLVHSGLHTALIWVVAGIIILAAVISLDLSWQVMLSWLLTVLLYLIFVFALRDCLAVMLAGLSHYQEEITAWFTGRCSLSFVTLLSWIFLVILHAGITFLICTLVTMVAIEVADVSIAYIIADWGSLIYQYLLFIEHNPLIWLAEALFGSATGDFLWLEKTVYLLMVVAMMLIILERGLYCLEARRQLPFDILSEVNVVKTKRYNQLPAIINQLCRLVPFSMSVILRKDLLQLKRDLAVSRFLSRAMSLAVVLAGVLVGIVIWFNTTNWAKVHYEKWLLEFSQSIAGFAQMPFLILGWLMLVITFGVVGCFSGGIKEAVTSFDAERHNIGFWRAAPVEIRYVAYSKMLLHFIISIILSIAVGIISCLILFQLIPVFAVSWFYLLIALSLAFCFSGVHAVVQIGATVLFPRFDWQHRGEVGGTFKSVLLECLDGFYVGTLCSVITMAILLPEYWGIVLSPVILSLLTVAIIGLTALLFICPILWAVNKKLSTW